MALAPYTSTHDGLGATAVMDSAPRRKRSKGGLNIFQYAGTVEQAAWNDEQQKKALEVRVGG